MAISLLVRSVPSCVLPARGASAALVLCVASVLCAPAQAQLTLTPDGVARNLSLTTFVSGFNSSSNIGPLGIAFPSGGGVMVTNYLGTVQTFANVDGQTAGSAPVQANYGLPNAIGLATYGSHIYMTQQSNAAVVELNADGTFNRNVLTSFPNATGIVTNPANGHLFVSTWSHGALIDLNPVTGTFTTVAPVSADGLSVSADGSVVYAAVTNGHIVGYNTATGVSVFDSGFIGGGIDGTALGAGLLAGNMYVNINNGTVVEVNMTTLVQTVIAAGGSRGDFVTVDPTDSSLLITQTDRIIRIHGEFVPAPGVGALLSLGLLAAGRRRR